MLRSPLLRALAVSGIIFGAAALSFGQNSATLPVKVKPPVAVTTPDPDGLTADERLLLNAVNDERARRGLTSLRLDPLLVEVARRHSREMAAKNYFDHHSPTPGQETPLTRCVAAWREAGQPLRNHTLVAENIYYCSLSDATYNAAYCHQALMNSPGHRANILDGRLNAIGLGTYRDSTGQFWATEDFQGANDRDGIYFTRKRYPVIKLAAYLN